MQPLKTIQTGNLCQFTINSIRVSKRYIHQDVVITRTGKPIIRRGGLGRSSRSGLTVTVFGGDGFIGTNLVAKLAAHGNLIVIPYRDEMKKRHLKPAGDLGVVTPLEFDIRNINSIEESIKNSDVVINLIGADYTTNHFNLYDVNVEAARRIASASAKYNVARLIHLSSFNAYPDSSSEFYRTKALGEQAVQAEFPEATIVRPAPVFGLGSKFLNTYKHCRSFYSVNNGTEKYYPTHIEDITSALYKITNDDSTAAKKYELYGPESFTSAEILSQANKYKVAILRNFPLPFALAFAKFSELFWINKIRRFLKLMPLTPDLVHRSTMDHTPLATALTYESLGIKPDSLGKWIQTYCQGSSFQNYSERRSIRAPGEKRVPIY